MMTKLRPDDHAPAPGDDMAAVLRKNEELRKQRNEMTKAYRQVAAETYWLRAHIASLKRLGDKLRTGAITGDFDMDDLTAWDELKMHDSVNQEEATDASITSDFHVIPTREAAKPPHRMVDIAWAGVTFTDPRVLDLGGIPVIVAMDDVGGLLDQITEAHDA